MVMFRHSSEQKVDLLASRLKPHQRHLPGPNKWHSMHSTEQKFPRRPGILIKPDRRPGSPQTPQAPSRVDTNDWTKRSRGLRTSYWTLRIEFLLGIGLVIWASFIRKVQFQLGIKHFNGPFALLCIDIQAAELDVAFHVSLVIVNAVQRDRECRPSVAKVEKHLLAGIAVLTLLLLELFFVRLKAYSEGNPVSLGHRLLVDVSEP